jgi:hypothetical protein
MTNQEWERSAEPLRCLIDLFQVICPAKAFKTGSRGWYGNAKTIIGDERVQVSITCTVIGSKPKPETPDGEQVSTSPKKRNKRPAKASEMVQTELVTSQP